MLPKSLACVPLSPATAARREVYAFSRYGDGFAQQTHIRDGDKDTYDSGNFIRVIAAGQYYPAKSFYPGSYDGLAYTQQCFGEVSSAVPGASAARGERYTTCKHSSTSSTIFVATVQSGVGDIEGTPPIAAGLGLGSGSGWGWG